MSKDRLSSYQKKKLKLTAIRIILMILFNKYTNKKIDISDPEKRDLCETTLKIWDIVKYEN